MNYEFAESWAASLAARCRRVEQVPCFAPEGRLRRVVGLTLEAAGCEAPVGSRCLVTSTEGGSLETEVVGFSDGSLYLMPIGVLAGVLPNARVKPYPHSSDVAVGDALLGRVIDSRGEALDGKGGVATDMKVSLRRHPINPMKRRPISEPLDVGVRAINALLTVGHGQRIGLFAGSGVGKSTLLGMMTRFTSADVVVVGLVGERGREVREFVEQILGEAGRERAVIVAEPSDASPLSRLRGAQVATAIAEHFRDRGQRVLLLVDSLTRYAQAQREIALAIGEPPATKGYPPSVFASLSALVERAGNSASDRGSLTAFYTVLTEGDDYRHDPIADAARAILDGHIVLSRDLAEAGHYPAIDIEASISRVMPAVVSPEHLAMAQHFRQIYSAYCQQRDLITIGAYQAGTDARVDEAIALWPAMSTFLKQDISQAVNFNGAVQALTNVLPATSELPTTAGAQS